MKKSDKHDLRVLDTAELEKQLATLIVELGQKRAERSAGKLANTALVKTLSDKIAVYKTILKERQLA